MSIQAFCPFLNQVVCYFVVEFRNSLYILDINPLSDIQLQIFSPILCGLSTLFIEYFDAQNF